MPNGNLNSAINQAMSICWDESIGYRLGGMAYSSSDGVDCSGLVGRVLSDNGFNYPSYHVGTINMQPELINAGFTIIPVSTLQPQLVSGDIVVMNHLDLTGGHTFFYVENVKGYSDASADLPTINNNLLSAKCEASSDRGHSGDGDSQKNGTGAYWEVWVHAYAGTVIPSAYDPQDSNNEVYIARWDSPYNPLADIVGAIGGVLLGITTPLYKRRYDKRKRW